MFILKALLYSILALAAIPIALLILYYTGVLALVGLGVVAVAAAVVWNIFGYWLILLVVLLVIVVALWYLVAHPASA